MRLHELVKQMCDIYFSNRRLAFYVAAGISKDCPTHACITAKATETNIWQTMPGFPIDPILLSVLIAIVIAMVIAFLLVRRKKKPTEAQGSETQSQNPV